MVQIKFLKLLVLYITNKFKNIFYSDLMEKVKGGFPPINYVDTQLDTNKQKSTRERSFVSTINKQNINIREILKENDNSIKPLIDINQSEEKLDVLDSF